MHSYLRRQNIALGSRQQVANFSKASVICQACLLHNMTHVSVEARVFCCIVAGASHVLCFKMKINCGGRRPVILSVLYVFRD